MKEQKRKSANGSLRPSTFLHDHSLSLVLAGIWAVLFVAAALAPAQTFARDVLINLQADTFGALLVVIATKYFIERGSAESKDKTDDED